MKNKKEWSDLTSKQKITGISALVFFIFIVFLAINDFGEEKTPNFLIENKHCMGSIKCSFDVRISQKISEREISVIANKIKKSSPATDANFILYYLPCMKINDGAWATSHFNPDLKVEIQDYMLETNQTCSN